MMAQPRRIAAVNVYNRLKHTCGEAVVSLRMGFGVREGVGTGITVVTTGKLARYLARCLLNSITHIIIDEVHERTIENDLVCLFARNLLSVNPNLKIILMSATIHYTIYQDYFGGKGEYGNLKCLSVGERRFPIEIKYVEDIGSVGETFSQKLRKSRYI